MLMQHIFLITFLSFSFSLFAQQNTSQLKNSQFDFCLGKWLHTWVDDSGGYLDFVGEFRDNKMILERNFENNGNKISQRMIFYNISENSLDRTWEISVDGGNTFELKWETHYIRLE